MCPRFLPLPSGTGSEPASAAPGGGRPSPGFTLSSSRLATIHRQNSKPQDLRPALCLLRRPAEGKGCLQAEDGPLDSGCHCLGLPSSRRALPAQVACPLYERRGILLGVGSWRLADRYCRAAGWATPNTFARFYSLRVEPVSSRVLTSGQRHGEVRLSVGLLRYRRLLLQRVPIGRPCRVLQSPFGSQTWRSARRQAFTPLYP